MVLNRLVLETLILCFIEILVVLLRKRSGEIRVKSGSYQPFCLFSQNCRGTLGVPPGESVISISV